MRLEVVGQCELSGKLLVFTPGATFQFSAQRRHSRGLRRHIRRQKAAGVVYPRQQTRRIVSIDPETHTVTFE